MDLEKVNLAELASRAKQLYEEKIRSQVEHEKNIGRMVLIDVVSGDFEVDARGTVAATRLRERCPSAIPFGIRIGYKAAETIGGVLERVATE